MHRSHADLPACDDAVDEALRAHQGVEGALLPVLWAVQERLGYLPPESLPRIAAGLNLSRAEVHGVVSFYHDFRTTPPGQHTVKVCRAEACQAMGSSALAACLERRLGAALGETSPDGVASLEAVYCLGNCALAPAVQIDGALRGRATPESLESVFSTWAHAAPGVASPSAAPDAQGEVP